MSPEATRRQGHHIDAITSGPVRIDREEPI